MVEKQTHVPPLTAKISDLDLADVQIVVIMNQVIAPQLETQFVGVEENICDQTVRKVVKGALKSAIRPFKLSVNPNSKAPGMSFGVVALTNVRICYIPDLVLRIEVDVQPSVRDYKCPRHREPLFLILVLRVEDCRQYEQHGHTRIELGNRKDNAILEMNTLKTENRR
jgi:hypothetical protein